MLQILRNYTAALAMLLMLQGCPGGMPRIETAPDPTAAEVVEEMTTQERAIYETKKGINAAFGMIAGFNITVTTNVETDIWSPDKGERLLLESDALYERLVEARELLKLGDLSGAEATRNLVYKALIELQRKAGQAGEQ